MHYLQSRGKKGILQYRRVVPSDVKTVIGKREFLRSTGTSDPQKAAVLAKRFDLEAEVEIANARGLDAPALSPMVETRRATDALLKQGAHRTQEPRRSDFSSSAEFEEVWSEWNEVAAMTLEALQEHLEVWQEQGGWERSYRLPDEREQLMLDHLRGTEALPVGHSWRETFELYLQELRLRQPMPEKNEVHREKYNRQHASFFAEFLGHGSEKVGWETPIEDVTAQDGAEFRRYYFDRKPKNKPGSWNRCHGVVNAAFNLAFLRFGIDRRNPLSGLKLKEEQIDKPVRVFKPNEWLLLKEVVEGISQTKPELYLITRIMIETGCRTAESWGLQLQDLRLRDETPHLWFQNNELRSLKRRTHHRPMVILEPLCSLLRLHAGTLEDKSPKAPLFPKTVLGKRVTDNVSTAQLKLIRSQVSVDPTLRMYSARHTNITIAETAQIPSGLSHYMHGHEHPETTTIHRKYLHGHSLSEIAAARKAMLKVDDWGYDWSPAVGF